MILYQLHCADEHSFEAWFRDSTSYEQQVVSGDVECPYCGSTTIAKSPMAPNIASPKNLKEARVSAPLSENAIDDISDRRAHEVAQQILDAVGRIREHAKENLDDVGDDFPDEARKIHYGETKERGIYGQASEEDADELEDEGIDIVRLPGTPRRDS